MWDRDAVMGGSHLEEPKLKPVVTKLEVHILQALSFQRNGQ